MQMPISRTVCFWLAAVIAFEGMYFTSVAIVLVLRGNPARNAIDQAYAVTASPGFLDLMQTPPGTDSWKPMLKAYQTWESQSNGKLYQIFFADGVKFQYPPSSLLPFDLLPNWLTSSEGDRTCGPAFMAMIRCLSIGAVLLTALGSTAILEVGLARHDAGRLDRSSWKALRITLAIVVCLTYYPLIRGYRLGQIQVFLDAMVALAILSHLLEKRALSGALLGACCLVKPQYGVLLLWSLLRRGWRFAVGFAAILVAGLIASVARFGLDNQLRYLEVLRTISRRGEVFWANQSVNGLMNRVLENGDPVEWAATQFAPFHPVVYAITVVSSIAILAIALVPWGVRHPRAEFTIDLMVMLAAATIASPIAWEHHYGVFLPIFAALLPMIVTGGPLGKWTMPAFALSFTAMANVVNRPDLIFRNRWLGLVGSHMFFGALILFALLLAMRAGGPARYNLHGRARVVPTASLE